LTIFQAQGAPNEAEIKLKTRSVPILEKYLTKKEQAAYDKDKANKPRLDSKPTGTDPQPGMSIF
jgi:hypothetical protein